MSDIIEEQSYVKEEPLRIDVKIDLTPSWDNFSMWYVDDYNTEPRGKPFIIPSDNDVPFIVESVPAPVETVQQRNDRFLDAICDFINRR